MSLWTFSLVLLTLASCSKKEEPTEAPAAATPAGEQQLSSSSIEVPDIEISDDPADIKKGEEIFANKGCAACHKIGGGKLVGPDLKGVMARRDEKWTKKMILRPDLMVKDDELARKLLAEHMTPMPNQGVDPKSELPYLLAYLKSNP